MIVHDLTDEERNIPIDLTTDDIDSYLSYIRKSISYMYIYIVHILDSRLFNLLCMSNKIWKFEKKSSYCNIWYR
jgi:hypothetical protein